MVFPVGKLKYENSEFYTIFSIFALELSTVNCL